MGVFGMFKHIAGRKTDELSTALNRKDLERVDKNIPLGIKIHCMIRLDETKFILNAGQLKVESPGGGTHTVTAAEKFEFAGLTVYRAYMESNENKSQSILQIPIDRKGEITDITLFRIFDEVYPANEEEWDQWLNDENGLIGYRDFQITNDDGSVLQYNRFWGGDAEYQEPFSFESTVSFDPYGTTGMKTRNRGMIYGRDVNETLQEYLMITQETVLDDSGGIAEAKVVLMLGINLDKPELEVMA